jgi:hypothetical protein
MFHYDIEHLLPQARRQLLWFTHLKAEGVTQ